MRLGFAIAAHLEADVLLLDEVFAVGDEAFQRKCFGKIFDFKQRGGTIVFVSHDASAVERLCQRAILLRQGEVAFEGETHEAIVEYHRQLADERNPEEREAGLKEWGSGEARIASARLLGPEGEERQQFAAGDPLTLRVELEASQPLPPPRLTYELRDEAGLLLAGGVVDTAELGWDDTGCVLRFDVPELPLADGRFRLRLGLSDAPASTCTTRSTTRLRSSSTPAGESRGLLRLEGRWSQEPVGAAANTGADELPLLSRLAAPDGARAGPPVQALHRRRGEAAGRGAHACQGHDHERARDLLRSRPPRLLCEAHRAERPRAALPRSRRLGRLARGRRRVRRHLAGTSCEANRARPLAHGRTAASAPHKSSSSERVLRMSAAVAQPRRAVATESAMFPSPRTECASVEQHTGTPASIAWRT